MQKTGNLLRLCRTITTLTPKYKPFSFSASSLSLEPYSEYSPFQAVYSQNRAIDGLLKSGNLEAAHKLFDEMLLRDVVTYNLLISGHGKYGVPEQAFYLYYGMVSQGISESAPSFTSILSVCKNAGLFKEGIQVHCRVFRLGFGRNLFVGSSLVDLYLHMGLDDSAVDLFDELPERNLATWNLVLRGFCELGRFGKLLGAYCEMKSADVEANGVSFCYLIRGCGNERSLDEGKQLHCHVIKVGWVGSDIFVANALVDFYSACGSLVDARNSFEVIPLKDVISWNAMVSLYASNGLLLDACELFHQMQFWGKRPSIHSFVSFLNLASMAGDILLGMQFHSGVLKMGFNNGNVLVQSALIDVYGKCKDIESSISIYENVEEKTLECCNSLMTSLLHCGIVDDVVELFGLMVDEGIGLDEVTFSTTIKALSESALASFASCRLVHCCAVKFGFESDIAVSCSLIDAYSRWGQVQLAEQVFEQLTSPNVICFTSMINGYARNRLGRKCLELLQAVISKGLKPDRVTFLCVLSGCSHSGLVEEGWMIFHSMKALYGISPNKQHFSCMVSLLGRAGLVEEAEELLQQAPGRGDCVMWSSLLRSCILHRNEMVGRRAAKQLLELDPEDFAVYLQVSNFYSQIGEFEASMQMREFAIARKMTRDIGHS